MKTMKTIKTIAGILLLSALVFLAYPADKTTTTAVVDISDVTDDFLLKPNLQDVLVLYSFDQSKWNGADFRFSDITQVSFNRVQHAKIEAENEWRSNRFLRENKIKQVQKKIADILTQAQQATAGQNNSSVYYPLAQELNRLAQIKADKKYMLIYSDLMENSNLSFYKKDILKKLNENPEEVRNILESNIKLQSLDGITIFFLFQPNNIKEDERYKIASKFFKDFFESKGAKVEITTSVSI